MDHEQAGARKLAAILSADVAGYSRLMGEDEHATVHQLTAYRTVFKDLISRHKGRVVDTAGDSVLAEFSSVVEAVKCAADLQHELAQRNAELPEARRMEFRIGVNLGDVIVQDDALYGDGVNIAARLQALAEPGGICISGTAFDQVESRLPLEYADLGEQQVKNIPKPVRAYKVLSKPGAAARVLRSRRAFARTSWIWALAVTVAVALAVTAGVGWHRWMTPKEDPVLAMPTGPVFAVLPFSNMSGDPGQQYFIDGITEEIITELARFKNLRVLARNSTFPYKGRAVDIRQVASELRVDFVLEGSVRRAGDKIRVTAQLLDGKNGDHVWAETYERRLTPNDIFAIQDEITQAITATVAGSYGVVTRAGWSKAILRSTESLSAYECVLRAKWYNAESLLAKDHLEVRQCLEQAVQKDPRYAEAWAWLAFVYTNEHSFGYNARPNPIDRALDAALTAERLSPDSGEVLRHLTMVHYFYRDPKFVDVGNRAMALSPHDAAVIAEVGLMLGFSGDWDRGAAIMRKAIALSPKPPHYYYNFLVLHHYLRREYDEALAWAERIAPPSFFWVYVNRAALYGQLGRRAEAKVDLNRLAGVYPTFAQNARREYRMWFWREDDVNHMIEGLRKAGLKIPDE